jgi:hypothetical protein
VGPGGIHPCYGVGAGAKFVWPSDSKVPFIGDADSDIDERHRRLDTLFVDSSGFGRALEELMDEHGPVLLAPIEQGQFRVYVGVWGMPLLPIDG